MISFTYEEEFYLNEEFKNGDLDKEELLNSLKKIKTDELTKVFIESLILKIKKLSLEEYQNLVENIPFDTPFL